MCEEHEEQIKQTKVVFHGKSTLIMGLIQNYLSRFNNIKLLITSSNKKLLTHLANRIISQKTILIPQNLE